MPDYPSRFLVSWCIREFAIRGISWRVVGALILIYVKVQKAGKRLCEIPEKKT